MGPVHLRELLYRIPPEGTPLIPRPKLALNLDPFSSYLKLSRGPAEKEQEQILIPKHGP